MRTTSHNGTAAATAGEQPRLQVRIKLKRLAKVSAVVVCALVLLAVVCNGAYDTQFVIVPDWGFTVRELEIGTVYLTNGVAHSFTNRISHIGPIILTEFNVNL